MIATKRDSRENLKSCGNVFLPDIHIALVTQPAIIQSLKEHVKRLPCAMFSVSLAAPLFEWPTETQARRWGIAFAQII